MGDKKSKWTNRIATLRFWRGMLKHWFFRYWFITIPLLILIIILLMIYFPEMIAWVFIIGGGILFLLIIGLLPALMFKALKLMIDFFTTSATRKIPERVKKELKSLSEEQKNEIREEINQCIERGSKKRFDKAREEHPIGRKLVGKKLNLRQEILVKLEDKPSLVNGSYKIPVKKLPVGEEIEVLDYVRGDIYVIRAKDIDRGYVDFEELGYLLDKQLDYQEVLFNERLEELAKKYNVSRETLRHI